MDSLDMLKIDEPQLLNDEGVGSDGDNILGHLFGSIV